MEELTQIEELYNRIPLQIIASFSTDLHQFKIDQYEISISTEMNEESLNQLLKNMMENQIDQQTLNHTTFQFLIEGHFLRGKLKSHLVRFQIGCEKTINIEYILGFQNLNHSQKFEDEDWISYITEVIGVENVNKLAVGLYSGVVSLYNESNKKIVSYGADEDALKAGKIIPSNEEGAYYSIAGGVNERLTISYLNFEKHDKINHHQVSENNHEGSILSMDFNPNMDGHLCTVGSSGSIFIWKIPEGFHEVGTGHHLVKNKKKKKELNLNVLPLISSERVHEDSIESTCWMSTNKIMTGSSDHTMKVIDVEKVREVRQILTKDSITTSIDYSDERILTSHEDGYLRLWDLRNPTNPANTFKSHSKFASSVRFNRNHNIFASGSYDHTVKIWDCRSIFPLQTIATHLDKVLTVCWKNEKELASGGSDSMINFHSI